MYEKRGEREKDMSLTPFLFSPLLFFHVAGVDKSNKNARPSTIYTWCVFKEMQWRRKKQKRRNNASDRWQRRTSTNILVDVKMDSISWCLVQNVQNTCILPIWEASNKCTWNELCVFVLCNSSDIHLFLCVSHTWNDFNFHVISILVSIFLEWNLFFAVSCSFDVSATVTFAPFAFKLSENLYAISSTTQRIPLSLFLFDIPKKWKLGPNSLNKTTPRLIE